ncbi:hypothetical protein [Corynebacterium auris]|uniref:hypothetical protein n=1 Tax=Corynebacterium auris TaxID=44750 RepID=UPI0025B57E0B|nr:hypothetical protein [Corynebacterium auris]WJY68882.1 CDP-6-deoxy-delta-3,4-glucoseen reductase [Corynebacterium auris]
MGSYTQLREKVGRDGEALRRSFFVDLAEHVPLARGIFPAEATTAPASLIDALLWLLRTSPGGSLSPATARRLRALALDFRRFGFPASAYRDFAAAAKRALAPLAGSQADALLNATAELMRSEAEAADAAGIPAATAARVASVDPRGAVTLVRLEAGMGLGYQPGQYMPVMAAGRQGEWRNLAPALPANPFGQLEFHVTDEFTPQVGAYVTLGAARGPALDLYSREDLLIVAAGTGAAVAKAIVFALAQQQDRPRTHLLLQAPSRAAHYDYQVFSALAELHGWFSLSRAPLGADIAPELWRGRRVVVSGASTSVREIADGLRGAASLVEIAPDAPVTWD